MEKPYYHLRGGGFEPPQIDLKMLCRVFGEFLHGYTERGYLQKAFGYTCVDAGVVPGEKGSSLATHLLMDALISTCDPVWDNLEALEEKQILGMHEAIFHVVAKPLKSGASYHDYSNCGWHFSRFDPVAGQTEYVEAVNKYLCLYPPRYKLTAQGILELLMDEPAATILSGLR